MTVHRQRVWLSTPQVADLLGVSERTLRRWRANKEGPPFRLFGSQIRYHRTHLAQWEAGHPIAVTPAPRKAYTRG